MVFMEKGVKIVIMTVENEDYRQMIWVKLFAIN